MLDHQGIMSLAGMACNMCLCTVGFSEVPRKIIRVSTFIFI
jgi:hypothetical protein